jgi:hypothetical protein
MPSDSVLANCRWSGPCGDLGRQLLAKRPTWPRATSRLVPARWRPASSSASAANCPARAAHSAASSFAVQQREVRWSERRCRQPAARPAPPGSGFGLGTCRFDHACEPGGGACGGQVSSHGPNPMSSGDDHGLNRESPTNRRQSPTPANRWCAFPRYTSAASSSPPRRSRSAATSRPRAVSRSPTRCSSRSIQRRRSLTMR